MEQAQAQQRHQQVELQDLVNDFLSPSSACVPTTADPPRRRRRQRPHLETSCILLDSPLYDSLRSPSRSRTPSRSSTPSRKRAPSPAASKGPSPTTTPKHDSLRANSRRKFLSTHKWGNDSPLARSLGHGSPLPLAPQHRRVFSECTSPMPRAQTAGPLSQPAHPHILVEQLQQPQRSSRQLARAPQSGRARSHRLVNDGDGKHERPSGSAPVGT
ncbi:hypothetical protein T484DRAFT_1974400 [Baffinella frigidus]|nr:hypothetical protein T484DRAFT_1974400 [Cryptophyta sp. CCMP2293]